MSLRNICASAGPEELASEITNSVLVHQYKKGPKDSACIHASDKISPPPRCNKNRSLAIACRLFTSDFDIQSRGEFRAFLLPVFSVLPSFDRFIVGRKRGQPISANRDLVDGDPAAAERTGARSKQRRRV